MGKSSTTPASTGRGDGLPSSSRSRCYRATRLPTARHVDQSKFSRPRGTLSWQAIQIVDLFHALLAALVGLGASAYANDTKRRNAWIDLHQKRWLHDKGKITKLVESLRQIQTTDAELAKKIRNEAHYFATNAVRMNYPKFRKQHLFVGSGVIEAGCKTVASSPQTIRHVLDVKGANSILALRCSHLNGRFEDYWVGRRAA